jgi:hypothetical protein
VTIVHWAHAHLGAEDGHPYVFAVSWALARESQSSCEQPLPAYALMPKSRGLPGLPSLKPRNHIYDRLQICQGVCKGALEKQTPAEESLAGAQI